MSNLQETTVQKDGADTAGLEFLTFRLGREEYGVAILKVQEIRSYDAVTAIANAPAFIKGIINLRGVIVPIIDLRLKFGLGNPQYDAFTVVIILNVAQRVVGIVVDSVSDVLTLRPNEIKAAPEFSSDLNAKFITGVGTVEERMVILTDIEQLITDPSMALVNAVTFEPAQRAA